jgi:hypothetical protein
LGGFAVRGEFAVGFSGESRDFLFAAKCWLGSSKEDFDYCGLIEA